MVSVALWSFAVFLASVFAGLLTGITLTPRYKGTIRAAAWTAGAVLGYAMAFVSYSVNLYNDAVGILGLSALVCIFFTAVIQGQLVNEANHCLDGMSDCECEYIYAVRDNGYAAWHAPGID